MRSSVFEAARAAVAAAMQQRVDSKPRPSKNHSAVPKNTRHANNIPQNNISTIQLNNANNNTLDNSNTYTEIVSSKEWPSAAAYINYGRNAGMVMRPPVHLTADPVRVLARVIETMEMLVWQKRDRKIYSVDDMNAQKALAWLKAGNVIVGRVNCCDGMSRIRNVVLELHDGKLMYRDWVHEGEEMDTGGPFTRSKLPSVKGLKPLPHTPSDSEPRGFPKHWRHWRWWDSVEYDAELKDGDESWPIGSPEIDNVDRRVQAVEFVKGRRSSILFNKYAWWFEKPSEADQAAAKTFTFKAMMSRLKTTGETARLYYGLMSRTAPVMAEYKFNPRNKTTSQRVFAGLLADFYKVKDD